MLPDHGGDDLPGGQRTTPRRAPSARRRAGPEVHEGGGTAASACSPKKLAPPYRRRLRREARPAAASVLGVRVLEREPGLPELALYVVDLDAHQVHRAHRVDEAAHALHLEDEVAGALLLFKIQAVLEARAPAAYHGEAQAGTLQVLALDGLLHHHGGPVAQAHRRRRL